MRRLSLLAGIAVLLCTAPLAANAQRAWAINGASIFAGPGSDYPVVAQLAPGVGLRINGCLGDYQWCDVSFGANRGWAYAGDLGYAYQSSRVPVIEYGPRLALPVITFSVGNYWDRYYRNRSWYHERNDWVRHYNDHRNDYHGNSNWHGNDYHGNNNSHGNDYRGNGNRVEHNNGNERHAEQYRPNEAPQQSQQTRRNESHVNAPVQNDARRNETHVNGSVQNDGRGGYAPFRPRPGPNGTVAPTEPNPSTPGYYSSQQ